jgi:single-strand DNA-binding protein
MNSVTLVGRVGGYPDVKYFESGTVKSQFTLAVNRRKKDDAPDWFNCEAWGKTAEVIASYVTKGKQVAIKGHLKFDRWNDKQTGQERSRAVIHVDEIELLGSRSDTNAAPDDEE